MRVRYNTARVIKLEVRKQKKKKERKGKKKKPKQAVKCGSRKKTRRNSEEEKGERGTGSIVGDNLGSAAVGRIDAATASRDI